MDDKEWISRQDPYVCLEYGSSKCRTKTCTGTYLYLYIYNTDPCFVVAYVLYKLLLNFWISFQLLRNILWVWFPPIKLLDGGKNPTFQEKFVLPLIEGLRELNVVVWNSHTLTPDEFIGSGR